MKKLLTTLALLLTLSIPPLWGQYGEWLYEDYDSLQTQREEAWDLFDHYRDTNLESWHLNAYYREMAEWVDYKIACYQDSVWTRYEVFLFEGERYYARAEMADPAIYWNYAGDTTVIERRLPRCEEFKQYQLAHRHLLPITRDLRWPIPAAIIKNRKP